MEVGWWWWEVLPQNLRWLVVEVPIQGSKAGGFCGFWDQILRGNGWCFLFFSKSNWTFQDNPWFSRKKLGKGLEDENFSKKETNSHIRTKPGRRVEIHLKTVSLGKLVGWYFVKSLICLPFTRHHFGYPGKKYNEYIELAKFLIWIWSLCICLGLLRSCGQWIVRGLVAGIYRSVASTFFFLISHPVIRWPSVSPTWCLKFEWS